MNYYHQLISEATGQSNPDTLNEIEEMMRLETGGCLDHLNKKEFIKIAKIAFKASFIQKFENIIGPRAK